jgi:hypothetical protein
MKKDETFQEDIIINGKKIMSISIDNIWYEEKTLVIKSKFTPKIPLES